MSAAELFKSIQAALGAAAVLWGLFFSAAVVHTLVSGRRTSELLVAAWIFAIYAAFFAAALLLVLVPVLQLPSARRRGAAVSLALATLLSVATLVAISLYFRDGGDASTLAGLLAYWGRDPLSFVVAFSPFLVACAAFTWFRARAGRS